MARTAKLDARRALTRNVAVCTVGVTLLVSVGALFGAGGSLNNEALRLFSVTGLDSGMDVAEIGAGKGELSLMAARRVGPLGHVWSTEVDQDRIREIDRQAEKAGLKNLMVLEGGETDTGLPPLCCDVMFLRGVYHHFTRPRELDASMFRALRSGGRLAVIDFAPRWYLAPWKPRGVPANRGGHGIPRQVLIDELQETGFVMDRVIEDWPGRMYCVVVRKP
jgi:ubiquinone/menaquinone biosynthesis C-methylase UbiE